MNNIMDMFSSVIQFSGSTKWKSKQTESASSPLVGFGWLNDNMIKGLTRLLKYEQVIGYLIDT